MRNQLTILYYSENHADAQLVLNDLRGYNIELASYSEKDFKYNILELIESINSPVLLLLSHNWLTCGSCLYNSLPSLEQLRENKNLFVTIIDGIVQENGNATRVPTEIDKIRDVIPYMKYWQEAFLEARYNRINSATPENIEFEKATKAISLNLGDLLNFFRPINHPKLSILRRSNYQPVFDFFNFAVEKVETQDSTPESVETIPTFNSTNSVSQNHVEPTSQINHKEIPTTSIEPIETVDASLPAAIAPNEELEEELDLAQQVANQPAEVIKPAETATKAIKATSIANKIIKTSNNLESKSLDEIGAMTPPTEITPIKEDKTIDFVPIKSPEQKATKQEPIKKQLVKDITIQDEKAIEEAANLSIDSILDKAIEFFEEDKDEAGFQLFEKAIQNNYEDNATLRYYYAYYLAQRKSAFDEAIHQLDTILLYDSKNDNAYFLLAELAEIKENFALAKNYYLQTHQLNPDYPNINYRIGVILQDHFLGAGSEAAEFLEAEVRKDSDNSDARYRLGIYYCDSESTEERAKVAFLKVLELDPKHNFANYDLALIYHKQGDAFKAAYYYKKGCINNPELKTEQNDIAFLAPAATMQTRASSQKTNLDNNPIQTKTILITGATSGIGLATAEKFANTGNCRLILAGRRKNRLEQIKDAILENFDIQVEILEFDVRDYLAVKKAIESLATPFNKIDVLINNAGLALGFNNIASGDLKDWETMIDTNLKGLLYMTKEVAALMIAQNGGHIINIGSIAGKEAYTNGNVYNATKAAVEILTKAIRLDLHKYNIRVGQVAPGHVETEFAINRFHGDEEKAKIYEDFTPLSAGDIANMIYFIVNQPAHVNIQDILVFPTQQASATVIHRSGRSS